MWELAGSVARVLKNHAAKWGSWALGRALKSDAANIIFSRGSWLALGRTLKNDSADIISSVRALGAAQEPRFWRPPSAHQFLIDRAMNFGIFWPTSGSGPFQLPVTLFSYVARRTQKNCATNINFSCGSWPAPRCACLKITLRTPLSYVGASWATGAHT